MKKRFNISQVFKQREKLFLALKPYIDANISGQVFKDVVEDVYLALPDSVSHDAVFESARCLAGSTLSRKQAAEFCWRVAGNIALLNDGQPVIPWTMQIRDEWLPVQILRVTSTHKNYRPGYTFQCRALAGSSCPMIFDQFLSRASCAGIAHTIGFNRSMPYTNGLHFTNLRMWVWVEAARSVEAPQFQQVDCSSAMTTHNRKLIAIRTRAQMCPRNFSHLCEHCEIGYDECPAAIFPKRLEKKLCENCNETRYFDPSRQDKICMACVHNNAAADKIAGM